MFARVFDLVFAFIFKSIFNYLAASQLVIIFVCAEYSKEKRFLFRECLIAAFLF
jgi:hypothetical protein